MRDASRRIASTLMGVAVGLGSLLACGRAGETPAPDGSTAPARTEEIYLRMVPVGASAEIAGAGSTPPARDITAEVVTVGRSDVVSVMPGEAGELAWPVEIEPGSRLRFGTLPTVASLLTAEVSVRFRDAGGEEVEVLHRSESWGPDQEGVRWADVPLGGISGAGELLFRSSSPAAGASSVRWVNPTLLGPERRGRPNVVVVCIDTLRADRALGDGGRELMPNLARRMAAGTVFEQAYANSSWSLPSMATILTGLYPGQHNAGRRAMVGESEEAVDYNARVAQGGIDLTINHKVYRFQMLHPSVLTLQETLGGAGYLTGAIHNNGYVSYPTRVLEDFDYVEHYKEHDAAVGTARALDWIDGIGRTRFLLFLHYIDPHQWPRRIPEELRGKPLQELQEADREAILGTYDSLVRYTDTHLEDFFRGLEERGLAEETLVVLLADHGERFFEKGVTGSHGGSFLETVIHVPLAFWGPSVPPGTVAALTHLVDVVPTVLDVVGEPSPARFQGRSLRAWMLGDRRGLPDREVISEFVLWGPEQAALLDGPWKYVYYPEVRRGELYDRLKDPRELNDLAEARPEVAARLHERLTTYLRNSAARFAALEYGRTAPDDKMLDSLRALGYID